MLGRGRIVLTIRPCLARSRNALVGSTSSSTRRRCRPPPDVSSWCRIACLSSFELQRQQLFFTSDAKTEKPTVKAQTDGPPAVASSLGDRKETEDEKQESRKEEPTKNQKLMEKIKEAGIAGVISFGLWEVAFWSASFALVIGGYYQLTGEFPDITDQNQFATLSAQAFVYVNFSRFALPLRIGLALSTTPWVERHIVEPFMHRNDDDGPKKPE